MDLYLSSLIDRFFFIHRICLEETYLAKMQTFYSTMRRASFSLLSHPVRQTPRFAAPSSSTGSNPFPLSACHLKLVDCCVISDIEMNSLKKPFRAWVVTKPTWFHTVSANLDDSAADCDKVLGCAGEENKVEKGEEEKPVEVITRQSGLSSMGGNADLLTLPVVEPWNFRKLVDNRIGEVSQLKQDKYLSESKKIDLITTLESLKLEDDKQRFSGKVKLFNYKWGWGFISVDGGLGDVFVRIEHTRKRCVLNFGDRVEFSIQLNAKGKYEAVDVSGPNGADLQPRKRGVVSHYVYKAEGQGGYGFITPDDGGKGKDIMYYGQRVVQPSRLPLIGEEAEYIWIEAKIPERDRAVFITAPGFKPFNGV